METYTDYFIYNVTGRETKTSLTFYALSIAAGTATLSILTRYTVPTSYDVAVLTTVILAKNALTMLSATFVNINSAKRYVFTQIVATAAVLYAIHTIALNVLMIHSPARGALIAAAATAALFETFLTYLSTSEDFFQVNRLRTPFYSCFQLVLSIPHAWFFAWIADRSLKPMNQKRQDELNLAVSFEVTIASLQFRMEVDQLNRLTQISDLSHRRPDCLFKGKDGRALINGRWYEDESSAVKEYSANRTEIISFRNAHYFRGTRYTSKEQAAIVLSSYHDNAHIYRFNNHFYHSGKEYTSLSEAWSKLAASDRVVLVIEEGKDPCYIRGDVESSNFRPVYRHNILLKKAAILRFNRSTVRLEWSEAYLDQEGRIEQCSALELSRIRTAHIIQDGQNYLFQGRSYPLFKDAVNAYCSRFPDKIHQIDNLHYFNGQSVNEAEVPLIKRSLEQPRLLVLSGGIFYENGKKSPYDWSLTATTLSTKRPDKVIEDVSFRSNIYYCRGEMFDKSELNYCLESLEARNRLIEFREGGQLFCFCNGLRFSYRELEPLRESLQRPQIAILVGSWVFIAGERSSVGFITNVSKLSQRLNCVILHNTFYYSPYEICQTEEQAWISFWQGLSRIDRNKIHVGTVYRSRDSSYQGYFINGKHYLTKLQAEEELKPPKEEEPSAQNRFPAEKIQAFRVSIENIERCIELLQRELDIGKAQPYTNLLVKIRSNRQDFNLLCRTFTNKRTRALFHPDKIGGLKVSENVNRMAAEIIRVLNNLAEAV